jgi:hypothetical protein
LALCVYRRKNAALVLRCMSEAVRLDWDVRLWALDQVHPDLERVSRGAGAGSRCALLNSLITGRELEDFDWIIINAKGSGETPIPFAQAVWEMERRPR